MLKYLICITLLALTIEGNTNPSLQNQQVCHILTSHLKLENKTKKNNTLNQKPSEKKFLLVTGCARSGTSFISDFLYSNGLAVPHEVIGNEGSVSWFMAVNHPSPPWNYSSAIGYDFEHVFHQVRDPLKTISSVYSTEPLESWFYIIESMPQIKWTDRKIVKCAKYWYYWNLAAEKKAEFTYRIENVENVIDEMSQRLNYPLNKNILALIPRDRNTRGNHKIEVTWALLKKKLSKKLYHNIKEMAERYGYPTE